MSKKTLLVSFVAALVLLTVLASLIARSADLAPYKSDIEAVALESGLRLRIDGDMQLALVPLPGIEVNDVYVDLGLRSLQQDTGYTKFSIEQWPEMQPSL